MSTGEAEVNSVRLMREPVTTTSSMADSDDELD
jgi:hypothetical protein